MKYFLFFPTGLDQIDVNNDNVDVCIELTDGKSYTLVCATPDNLKTLMKRDGVPYLRPGAPMLFVEALTEANIRRLVDELMKDHTLLRFYGGDFSE